MKKIFLSLLGLSIFTLSVSAPVVSHALENEEFMPWEAESTITLDQYSRYSYQWMYWRDGGLDANGVNSAYEHQTIFYGYDNSPYSDGPLSTQPGYWDSNFPDHYLDTQALDSTDEPNVAIGTYNADWLQPWYSYYYWIRLNDYSSQSMYKISGQHGIAACNSSPWCVNGVQTGTIIPFKTGFYAPHLSQSSTYEWENNGWLPIADNVNLQQWGSGVIDNIADEDFWKFNISNSNTYQFFLQVPNGEDYDVDIRDANYNLITSGTAVGSESFTQWLAPGQYYAIVKGFGSSNDNTRSYSFMVR